MRKIIFASHGDFSKGLLESAIMITGSLTDGIETYSLYPGNNPNDYAEILKQRIQKNDHDYIILCDLKGGSVHTALSKLTIFENVLVFSGMNLNMVLEILFNKDEDLEKICESVLHCGKQGITGLVKNSIEATEDEDF